MLTRPKYSRVLITARDPGFDTSSSHSGQKTGYTSRLETTLSQNLASLASPIFPSQTRVKVSKILKSMKMVKGGCANDNEHFEYDQGPRGQ